MRNRMGVELTGAELKDALRAANGPEYYSRHVIQDYAHLDLWLGRDSARDVYPIALAELERHNS